MIWAGLLLFLAALLAAAEKSSRRRLTALRIPAGSTRRLLPDGLALLALALLGATLAVTSAAPADRSGPTLVLAIDVSRSMAAADVAPSRLERAKAEARLLLDGLPEARFALVPFAGEAVVQVPFTTDRPALAFFLDRLTVTTLAASGSGPEEAVTAARRLLAGEPGGGAIVLLTDGERTLDAPAPAIPKGAPLFIFPLGTETGAPLPDDEGRPRRGPDGVILQTRCDRAALGRLAGTAGGELIEAPAGAFAAPDLIRRLHPAPGMAGGAAWFWIALVALALLLRQLPWRPRWEGALVATLLVAGSLGACRNDRTPSPRQAFAEALALARSGEPLAAAEDFAALHFSDPGERAAALYNQGTLLLLANRPKEALTPLQQGLLLAPGDGDLRRNLALALRRLGADRPPGLGEGEENAPGGGGNDLSRDEALQLLEAVRPEVGAPPSSARAAREVAPRRDW